MSTVAVPRGILVTDRMRVVHEEEPEARPEEVAEVARRQTIFVIDEFAGFTDEEVERLSAVSNGRIWREMVKVNISVTEKTMIKSEYGRYEVINGFNNVYKENRASFIGSLNAGQYAPGQVYVSPKSAYDYAKILDNIVAETENADVVYLSVSEKIQPQLVRSVKTAFSNQTSKKGHMFFHIDSHSVSGGYALIASGLAWYTGTDFSAYIREMRLRCAHLFTVRDFSYLLASDKTFSLRRFMGTAATVAIKWAWLTVPYNDRVRFNPGATRLAKRVASKTEALISTTELWEVVRRDREKPEEFDALLYLWADYYFKYRSSPLAPVRISYAYGREELRARKLEEILTSAGASADCIEVVQTTAVVASLVGPTALGFYFVQKMDR